MGLEYSGERLIPGMLGEGATEHVHRYMLAKKIATGLTVLDVACGEGYGSALLAQVARRVIGIDIDSEIVAHAKEEYQTGNLEFRQGDCTRLPLDDACVDLVVSFETIEHHDQHMQMVREIRRVLRPDGVVVISSPNRPEFNRDRSEPYPFHVKELDYGELHALLSAEFSNVEFYGQRSVSGSLVVPSLLENGGFTDFDESMEGTHGLSRPIYFLALASNAALPRLGLSLFESHQTEEFFRSAPTVRELRLYFACAGDSGYDQIRSYGVAYPENARRQSINLSLQAKSQIQRIRLDLSNAPSAIWVHKISLQQSDGTMLWAWGGDTSVFVNCGGLSIRRMPAGVLFLCWSDDPQFDVALPREVLTGLPPFVSLVVELTPCPLADLVGEVLTQDDRQIAEQSSVAPRRSGLEVSVSTKSLSLGFSTKLESVSELLKNTLIRRDQIIAEQSKQIRVMRDEILRAEAQLELLKDVMLGGRGEDRL